MFISIIVSVENEKYPVTKSKVRANMILSGYYVKEETDPNTGKSRTHVTYYSEVDLKLGFMTRMLFKMAGSQVKTYVDKQIARMEQIYPK